MPDNIAVQVIVHIDGKQFKRLDCQFQRFGTSQRIVGAGGIVIGKGIAFRRRNRAVCRSFQRYKRRCRRPLRGIRHHQPQRIAQGMGHKTRHFISTKIIGVGIVAWVKPSLSRFQPILLHQRHGPGVQVKNHHIFSFAQSQHCISKICQKVVIVCGIFPAVARQRCDQHRHSSGCAGFLYIGTQAVGIAAVCLQMCQFLVIVAKLVEADIPCPQPRFYNIPVSFARKALGGQTAMGVVGDADIRQISGQHLPPAAIACARCIGQICRLIGHS